MLNLLILKCCDIKITSFNTSSCPLHQTAINLELDSGCPRKMRLQLPNVRKQKHAFSNLLSICRLSGRMINIVVFVTNARISTRSKSSLSCINKSIDDHSNVLVGAVSFWAAVPSGRLLGSARPIQHICRPTVHLPVNLVIC